VDDVQAGLGHSLECWPSGNAEAGGYGARALLDEISEPDDPDFRQALQRPDMELTDIASADKADTEVTLR
jgi:hypothetical protein